MLACQQEVSAVTLQSPRDMAELRGRVGPLRAVCELSGRVEAYAGTDSGLAAGRALVKHGDRARRLYDISLYQFTCRALRFLFFQCRLF